MSEKKMNIFNIKHPHIQIMKRSHLIKHKTTYTSFRNIKDPVNAYYEIKCNRRNNNDICIYLLIRYGKGSCNSKGVVLYQDNIVSFIHDSGKQKWIFDILFETSNTTMVTRYNETEHAIIDIVKYEMYNEYVTRIQKHIRGWFCRRKFNLKKMRLHRELDFMPPALNGAFPGGRIFNEAKRHFELLIMT